MVLWIGGRVESLVVSVIGGMAWVTTDLIALCLLPGIYQAVGCFSLVFIHVGSFSLLFCFEAISIIL